MFFFLRPPLVLPSPSGLPSGLWRCHVSFMSPPDPEPQTTHEKHDTRPVTAVRFASINVDIRT